MSWLHLMCVRVCMCVWAHSHVYEYGMVRWQESQKGGGKAQMDEIISRPSHYVGYSPSVSLC